jgi:mannose-6-phosphate isomerase-like protein (cupin superfamily)
MPVPQTPIDDGKPIGPGWFVVNLDGAAAARSERHGLWTEVEPADAPFEDLGINVHVLQPGQPNAMYHGEDAQEDFLVLYGECIAVIEDTEQHLRTWDLVHCPRGTRHVFVGAGDGPCAILMVGAPRNAGSEYPASEVAARHGAAAVDPANPYPGFSAAPERFSWPPAR